jgi:rhamnose transport system permease protein
LKLEAIQPTEDDRDRAFAETQTVLKIYPNVKLIITIAAPAVPSRETVNQSVMGQRRLQVCLLNNKPYVHSGVVEASCCGTPWISVTDSLSRTLYDGTAKARS